MKKIVIIIAGLFFASCSSDDSSGNKDSNDAALIKQIVSLYSSGFSNNFIISYDDHNRDSEWLYTDLQIHREIAEPVYPDGEPVFTYSLNVNPQGLVGEALVKSNGYAYAHYYTYDDRKRMIKKEMYRQGLGNNGTPTSNLKLMATDDFTWDDNNNLISVKKQYATSDSYSLTTFSDFTNFKNTLKPANLGFDFFGPYGYPAGDINGAGGAGEGSVYLREVCAGEYLPTKKVTAYFYTATNEPAGGGVYTYNMSYQKDDYGRVTEVLEEESQGSWYKVRYSY